MTTHVLPAKDVHWLEWFYCQAEGSAGLLRSNTGVQLELLQQGIRRADPAACPDMMPDFASRDRACARRIWQNINRLVVEVPRGVRHELILFRYFGPLHRRGQFGVLGDMAGVAEYVPAVERRLQAGDGSKSRVEILAGLLREATKSAKGRLLRDMLSEQASVLLAQAERAYCSVVYPRRGEAMAVS